MEANVARQVAMAGRHPVMVKSDEPVAKGLVWEGSFRRDGGRVARRKAVMPNARTRNEKADTTATFLAKGSWRWRTIRIGRAMMTTSMNMSTAPSAFQRAIWNEKKTS